jgi:hypothetical protein
LPSGRCHSRITPDHAVTVPSQPPSLRPIGQRVGHIIGTMLIGRHPGERAQRGVFVDELRYGHRHSATVVRRP